MSVQKSFVVKNGLEVNQKLIVADTSRDSVGIGTSVPLHTLHVFGGIGVTDYYSSGISTFGHLLYVGSAGTVFAVNAAGGVGIGTTISGASLHVISSPTSIAGLFSGSSSADMVRITQKGTGNAIVIEDSDNIDYSPFVINSAGLVGIGTTLPYYTLSVTSTGSTSLTGLSNCLADFNNDTDSYSQLNVRNSNTGSNASADIVITADNGRDNLNFVDLGINNSGYSVADWSINGANDAYLYTSDGSLSIGISTSNAAKYLSFFVGGTLLSNEIARINQVGVGIGTTNPTTDLYVVGNTRITGITSVGSLSIGSTQVLSDGQQLQNILSLDATTIATIEAAIKESPNTFTNITVTGVSTLGVTSATDLTAQNLNVSGVGTISTLRSTAGTITNLSGIGIAYTNLVVSGIATIDTLNATNVTIVGASVTNFTISNNLYVAGIGTIATGVITSLTGTNINYTGIGTIVTFKSTDGTIINLSGTIGTITRLDTTNLSGTIGTITTLKSTDGTITNLSGTIGTITTLNGTNLNYSGISTITNIRSTTLDTSGIGTITRLDTTNLSGTIGTITTLNGTDLNYSGISTLGTVRVSSGIITASSGIVTYYGDGQYLLNVTRGVGLGTTGGIVGYGATILYFQGPGISTITVSSGIATINVTGGGTGSASIGIGTTPGEAFVGVVTAGNLWYNSNLGRMFIYYQDSDSAQWVDASPSNVGVITSLTNVSFAAGSASSPSMYFIGDSKTGFFSPGAGQFTVVSTGSSVLNINQSGIRVTGVATATDFDSLSDARYKTNVTTINNALLKVDQMRGVKFDWKESGLPSYGVIAQELEEVLPELVHGTDPKAVNYNGIIGVLIEAIKELKSEIEELKNTK